MGYKKTKNKKTGNKKKSSPIHDQWAARVSIASYSSSRRAAILPLPTGLPVLQPGPGGEGGEGGEGGGG